MTLVPMRFKNYDLVCKLGENMVTEKEKKACRFIAEWL